jgi:hypothetical protein
MRYVVYGKRTGATWLESVTVKADSLAQASEVGVELLQGKGLPVTHILTVTEEVFNTACDEVDGWPSVERLKELADAKMTQ